ncbi:MAG: uracil phosphoribosyltransferase [Paludibacteraceae bacterium]|nr:uracil phosphoribosyltransferase [Paludibacteraceae bacterium]
MRTINLSEKDSLLSQYLGEIRDKDIQQDRLRFRRNIERIGEIMAVEISRELTYEDRAIETPLAPTTARNIKDQVVLGTILRAGLPFHQGFLNMFDRAENAFLSAYRRMGRTVDGKPQLEIVSEYLAAPNLGGKTLLLVDPMLATGMSMEVGYKALLSHGKPAHVHIACVIGTTQALEYLQQTMPEETTVWCAAVDNILNEKKYIVPGLGDAGDLCFGDKL